MNASTVFAGHLERFPPCGVTPKDFIILVRANSWTNSDDSLVINETGQWFVAVPPTVNGLPSLSLYPASQHIALFSSTARGKKRVQFLRFQYPFRLQIPQS